MTTHICGNPNFDMFTCLGCHPELAPKEPPPREDPFESGVRCVTMSFGDKETTYSVSMHLNAEEFQELKSFVESRRTPVL